MNNTIKWMVVNTCRLAVSATFVFSGLVKLIDPHGTAYKIVDYLTALGLEQYGQGSVPMVLSLGLALMEFCLGIDLFFGIRRRWTTRLLMMLMLIYTPLTLWLAWTDAVADCGCFGDALKLTNWQTFWKNVAVTVALTVVVWNRRQLTRFISEKAQWIISFYSFIYGGFLAGLSLHAEPLMDFRPFHIGQNIPEAMAWPDDPEKQPAIVDFFIESPEGEDLGETILADSGYTFLLIAPHLETADDGNMERINALSDYSKDKGYRFLCLTSSDAEAINRWCDQTGADYAFAFMDELTLKTIVRSNPGLILLHNGTIVGKWSKNTMPEESQLTAPLDQLPLAHPQRESHRQLLLQLLFWYVMPLVLLTVLDRFYVAVRWWWRRRRNH